MEVEVIREYAEVADKFAKILILLGFNVHTKARSRIKMFPTIMAAAYLSIIGCLAEGVSFSDEYQRLAEFDKSNWTEYKTWVGSQATVVSSKNLRIWRELFKDQLYQVITNDHIITALPRLCHQMGLENVISLLEGYTKIKKQE